MVAECKDRDFSSNARTIRLFRRAFARLVEGHKKSRSGVSGFLGATALTLRDGRTTVPMKRFANQRTTVFPCRLMTNVPDSGC